MISALRRLWRRLIGGPDAEVVPQVVDLRQVGPIPTTDWCLVGNIVAEHPFGEEKEMRRGSKHFTPGTKVYCLPAQWGDGYERVIAVGLGRGSRRFITVVLPRRLIANWRAKVVYKPEVRRRLREGFKGMARQWESREDVERVAEQLQRLGRGAR